MKRIYILKKHIASIPDNLYNEFKKNSKKPVLKWIKQEIARTYNLEMTSDENIEKFKSLIRDDYYENASEWIKEKMRKYISQNGCKKTNRIYIERKTNGAALYMQYDNINSHLAKEPIYTWTSNEALCAKFSSSYQAASCFKRNFSDDIEYEIKEMED